MRASSPAFFARASTTSVAVVPEAIDASFQLSEPAVTVTVPAFLSARADWKRTPAGAGTVIATLSFHSSVEFVRIRRKGYVSPGLTQPVDETNEFSSPRVGAGAWSVTGAEPV